MTDTKAIGLVGGLGPGATIYYYQLLTKAFRTRQIVPPLFIANADANVTLGLLNSGSIEDIAVYLSRQIACLRNAGSKFAAISSILNHICVPYLRRMISVPLLDIIDCIRTELVARKIRQLSILGTRPVMESNMFGRLDDWDVIRLSEAEINFVHENYMRIASAGEVAGSGADVEGIRALAKEFVHKRGAEIVLLGGTDISLAFREAQCGFPALDCARLHVDAIVRKAYGTVSS